MKTIGWILIIIGSLAIIGSLMAFASFPEHITPGSGQQFIFEIGLLGLGIYLVDRAKNKTKKLGEKEKWKEDGDKILSEAPLILNNGDTQEDKYRYNDNHQKQKGFINPTLEEQDKKEGKIIIISGIVLIIFFLIIGFFLQTFKSKQHIQYPLLVSILLDDPIHKTRQEIINDLNSENIGFTIGLHDEGNVSYINYSQQVINKNGQECRINRTCYFLSETNNAVCLEWQLKGISFQENDIIEYYNNIYTCIGKRKWKRFKEEAIYELTNPTSEQCNIICVSNKKNTNLLNWKEITLGRVKYFV